VSANSYNEDPVIALPVEPSIRDFRHARILEQRRSSMYFNLPKELQTTSKEKRKIRKHNESVGFRYIEEIDRFVSNDDKIVITEKSVIINGVRYQKHAARHSHN